MRNQVDYSVSGLDDLNRLLAAVADPDEVERVMAQIEQCLTWYDPRLDPTNTTNCGSVSGPGLLPAPLHTALRIEVAPPRVFFVVDDKIPPFIMTVVRVEWMLRAAGGP